MKQSTWAHKVRTEVLMVLVLTGLAHAAAGDGGWRTALSYDGRIHVSYRMTEQDTAPPLIEDSATTVAAVSMDDCIAVMKDVANHREFTGDKHSQIARTVTDSQWVVYYYTDNPWPIRNSDCAGLLTFRRTRGTAVFDLEGVQSAYPSYRPNRMTARFVRYTFTDLKDGTVRITVTGRSTPPVRVPRWLIRAAFPAAPAKGLDRLVRAITAQSARTRTAGTTAPSLQRQMTEDTP